MLWRNGRPRKRINHVPQVYQGMGGVLGFIESFKEFPPRSVPQSFNPANMLESTLRDLKAKEKIERAFPILVKRAVASEQDKKLAS